MHIKDRVITANFGAEFPGSEIKSGIRNFNSEFVKFGRSHDHFSEIRGDLSRLVIRSGSFRFQYLDL